MVVSGVVVVSGVLSVVMALGTESSVVDIAKNIVVIFKVVLHGSHG